MLKRNIKYLCKIEGIKIRELAQEIGINHNDLSRVRWYKNVKLPQLLWLEKRFNCPIEMLIKYDLRVITEKEMYEFIKKEIYNFENLKNLEQGIKKK